MVQWSVGYSKSVLWHYNKYGPWKVFYCITELVSRRKCQNTKNGLKLTICPPSPLEVYSFFSFYIHRGDLTLSHGNGSKVIWKQSDGLHRRSKNQDFVSMWWSKWPWMLQRADSVLYLLKFSPKINDFQVLLFLSIPSTTVWITSSWFRFLYMCRAGGIAKEPLVKKFSKFVLPTTNVPCRYSRASRRLRWRLRGS